MLRRPASQISAAPRRQAGRRLLISALAGLAVFAGGSAVAVALASTADAATPVRIMPLGDSITGSPGCWRALLWNRLVNAGYTNIDFVGTLGPQGCSIPYDGDNEGHGGALVTNVADQNQLVGWLSATQPDIVVMHFGTNDVWSQRSTSTILAAYSKLVDQMRASNPNMRILVAKIIPMAESACGSGCPQRVIDLNNAIPGWAASRTTSQSPITVVDQWTGFDTATDTYDGIHPNDSGNQKISDRWFPALATALGGTNPPPTTSVAPPPTTTVAPPTTTVAPPPTTTVAPPPTSTSLPPQTGGCSAAYRQVNSWPGGFQGEVTVTNTGSSVTTAWSVGVTFADNQRITQLWGGRTSQTASPYTVTNESWNGSLAPNTSAIFGFLGSWSGSNAAPALTCTRTP